MKYKEPAKGGGAAHYLPSRQPVAADYVIICHSPCLCLGKASGVSELNKYPKQPWEGSLAQPPRRCICIQSHPNLFGRLAEQDRAAFPRCIEQDA